MKTYLSWFAGMLVVMLLTVGPAHPEDCFAGEDSGGPVGSVEDEGTVDEDAVPGWKDLSDSQWGLAGLASEREPHDACEMCFTVPKVDEYQIYEYVETDGPEASIISRRIPNPAPLRDNEVRETVDEETGEPVWYIGTQAFIGPTDEEPWSEEIPLPYIELKRIRRRYNATIFRIPGVRGFGIGEHGFHVALLPEYADNADLVPTALEGVPVVVEIEEEFTDFGHERQKFRPLPGGAAIATDDGSQYNNGTLGPHVVRDRPHVSLCCQFWSLTNAHVVKQDPTMNNVLSPVYQPAPVFSDEPESALEVGTVAYAFTLTSCKTSNDPDCRLDNIPVNDTNRKPDIAAIMTALGSRTPPYNAPWTDLDPERKLYYSATQYENGPSGRIYDPRPGKEVYIWGAFNGGSATVKQIDRCITVTHDTGQRTRQCGLTLVESANTVRGDSGALTARRGTGKRDVVGVLSSGVDDMRAIIPARDIQDAFQAAGWGFSHYWGTAEGYRHPATR